MSPLPGVSCHVTCTNCPSADVATLGFVEAPGVLLTLTISSHVSPPSWLAANMISPSCSHTTYTSLPSLDDAISVLDAGGASPPSVETKVSCGVVVPGCRLNEVGS